MARLAVLLTFLCCTSVALAQPQVSVTMNASPRRVAVDDMFSLELRAEVSNGSLESFDVPDLHNFEILAHQTSKPMQFSFSFGSGSGRRMKSSSTTVHSLRLRPLREGTFKIPAAVAKVDGKEYRSQPIVIRVQGGIAAAPGDPTDAVDDNVGSDDVPTGDDGNLVGAKFSRDGFLQTLVDNTTPFVGEQINVVVKLYASASRNIRQVSPSKPDMEGFWVQDLAARTDQGALTTVNGTTFRVYELFRYAAFPLRAGPLRVGKPGASFLAGGSGFFSQGKQRQLQGLSTDIQVQALPAPTQPGSVVGTYKLLASVHPAEVFTGNAATIRVQAVGAGRVESLRLELPTIDGLRVLQPAIKDRQLVQQGLVRGTRTWEWIVIPQKPGVYTVPPFGIRAFDPKTKQYHVAKTSPLRITSTGTLEAAAVDRIPRTTEKPAATVQFGPIRQASDLLRNPKPVRTQPWFKAGLVVPPLVFLLALLGLVFTRRRARRTGTVTAVVDAALSSANQHLNGGSPRDFYDQVVVAIRAALDEKLAGPTTGMTQTELRDALRGGGVDDDLIERVTAELDGADFARFASAGIDKAEMAQCLSRVRAVVERLTTAAVILALTLSSALPASAETIRTKFEQANQHATHGRADAALSAYDALIQAGVDDPDVHYNMGSLWAEAGDFPRAIFHFENVLAHRPSDDNAARDLRRAERQLENARAEREGEATIRKQQTISEALFGHISENNFAWLLLVSNVCMFGALCWLLLRTRRRRWGLGVAAVSGMLLLFSAAGLAAKAGAFRDGQPGIVLTDRLALLEAPDGTARVRGEGRGADRCTILATDGGFVRLRLAGDGAEGWANAANVGRLGAGRLTR